MDDRTVGEYWERNAAAWTQLTREGYDVYRDLLNTPAFLEILPDVSGLQGLDIGCGEGANTRQLAERGARMWGVDIAPTFIARAREVAAATPIEYSVGSALALPFASGRFDFAVAFMSLMDVGEPELAIQEAYRVLRPGGFLQFSITHPCFGTPHRKLLRRADGEAYAVEVGRYYDRADGEIERWIFGSAPEEVKAGLPKFEVPRFYRTLSEWVNCLLTAGFVLERMEEPRVSEEVARKFPAVQDTRVVSYFLHVRVRK
jgi:SAM-dependent methyltransferase